MVSSPYYVTWGNQLELDTFSVRTAEHDEFVLEDGRRVYDFLSTSFQTNFGHSNEIVRAKVRKQLDLMPIATPKASFDLKHRVSERLIDLLDLKGGKVFYTTGGSESVENALKMARQVRGATKVLARRESYHGATLGALSVTGDWRNESHLTLDAETVRIPEPADDPNLAETRRLVESVGPDNVAAVILETISGTNGVAIPSHDWFKGIASLCRETGILLIADEVLCGFGRTGADFAFHNYDLVPDLVCMSKGITGGYVPFGAVGTGPAVTKHYDTHPLVCGLTSYAHPLGLAALDGVIDQLGAPGFREHTQSLGEVFGEALGELAQESCVGEVRRRGLLAAIELATPAPTWRMAFDRGLHLFSKGQRMVLAPPLVSEPERLRRAVSDLRTLVRETADATVASV